LQQGHTDAGRSRSRQADNKKLVDHIYTGD
jgi:hypothetical protein